MKGDTDIEGDGSGAIIVATDVDARHGVNNDASENGVAALDQHEKDLNSFGSIFRLISSLSIPMALSFTFSLEVFLIVVLLNNLSDEENEVAASSLISTMINTCSVIGMAPLFAMSVIAANKIGDYTQSTREQLAESQLQEKRNYIADINKSGIWISGMLTPPVMLSLLFSKPLLAEVFGQNDEVAQISSDFLQIYSAAIPALMVRMATEQTMFSFGRAKEAMYMALGSFSLSTALAVVSGSGYLGFPKLGPSGIAAAYVFESYLTALAYSLFLAKAKDFSKFKFFKLSERWNTQREIIKELMTIGGSITLTIASEMAMSFSLGILSGLVGTTEQSAITYINQFLFFNFVLVASFGQASSQELNRLMGAKRYDEANKMAKYSLLSTLIYTSPVPVFFAVFPNLLITSSAESDEVKDYLKWLVPILAVADIADAARYNLMQQLRPLGDVHTSTIISVTAVGVSVGSSALLGLLTDMGIYGVAVGYTGGVLLVTPILMSRWLARISPNKLREINEAKVVMAPAAPSSSSSKLSSCFASFFGGIGTRTRGNSIAQGASESSGLLGGSDSDATTSQVYSGL